MDMSEIPDEEVSLIVTSPPYWDAIDYNAHANDPDANYRMRRYNQYASYNNYLLWLEKFAIQAYLVTKPGGFMALVVGTILKHGEMYPLPFDIVPLFRDHHWNLHQDILWHKCTGGVKRAGVAIQHPYPGYYYPNIMNEYILVFRKPGPKIYKQNDERDLSEYPIDDLFKKDIANNIWHIAPIPPNSSIDHPCPFPEEIPWRLIMLYSYVGDLVLDPFAGSGQTLKVARAMKRRYVGYEIVKEYVDMALERVNKGLQLREEQLYPQFGKVKI